MNYPVVDGKNSRPTGFVAVCRCGMAVGAMDYDRMDKGEAAKILGRWLINGMTITPQFHGTWSVTIEPCVCIASPRVGA